MTSESNVNDTSRALSEAVAQAFPEGLPTAEQATERASELFATLQGSDAANPPRRAIIPIVEMSPQFEGVALSEATFSANMGAEDIRAAIAALGGDAEESSGRQ